MDQLTVKVKPRASKKTNLRSIEVEKGETGGHVLTHHLDSGSQPFQTPEKHIFGDKEGTALLAHIAHHMGVQPSEEPEGEEDREGG